MSALYSEAFDHLRDPTLENEDDDYSYQDPEVIQLIDVQISMVKCL